MVRPFLFMVARLITWIRVEPDNPLIIGIVRLMHTRLSEQLHTIAPAFGAFVLAPSVTRGSSKDRETGLADQAALVVAAISTVANNPDRAAEVLEAHVEAHFPNVASQVFERLAVAQISNNAVEGARQTLEKGLSVDPDNGLMHREIAKILADADDLSGAVMHWEKVPRTLRATADIWTVTGVARAYRLTGNPQAAYRLARQSSGSGADDELLQDEIRLCRPFIIDWPGSLSSAESVTSGGKAGEVTSMGFLHGGSEPLTGWVSSPENGPVSVDLLVNDHLIASTLAASNTGPSQRLTFSINCADLLQYIGDGDVVRVSSNGNRIALPELGDAATVECGEKSRFDGLKDRLREGFVFTKDGRLRPGHRAESKRAVLDLYDEISSVIAEGTGQPVFPFYGNLLGAVRENDFIAHDVDGFDILYLCMNNQPGAAKSEIAHVCRLLSEKGYDLRIEPYSVMIRRLFADEIFVDMNFGWFTDSDELNVSFGWRFTPTRGRAGFVASRHCQIADRQVRIPGNAEDVLRQLYGAGWRVRDQGFAARKHLIRDERFLLDESELRSLAPDKPQRFK